MLNKRSTNNTINNTKGVLALYALPIASHWEVEALYIIESVDSISRDERDAPLIQYITNAGISRAKYTITHFKHHHRVLWLISN